MNWTGKGFWTDISRKFNSKSRFLAFCHYQHLYFKTSPIKWGWRCKAALEIPQRFTTSCHSSNPYQITLLISPRFPGWRNDGQDGLIIILMFSWPLANSISWGESKRERSHDIFLASCVSIIFWKCLSPTLIYALWSK